MNRVSSQKFATLALLSATIAGATANADTTTVSTLMVEGL